MAMRTRKEQVQAYRFVTRRLVSALQSGEPETNELPMRRLGLAVLGSVMVALIVAAVMGVIGFLNPGGGKARAGVLIQEKETTAIYILDEDKDLLHPVANYASALLVLENPKPEIVRRSANSLKEYQRGYPIGIPDAPSSLPDKESLLQSGTDWQVCSTPWNATTKTLATHVVAADLSGADSLGKSAALVTADEPAGPMYLLWNDSRLAIDAESADEVLTALHFADVSATPVSTAVLDAIPAGPDLAAPKLSGDKGVEVDGEPTKVGDLFADGEEHYVMTTDGVAPIGEVAKLLLKADGREVTDITANELAKVLSDERAEPEGYPQSVPTVKPLTGDRPAVCATQNPGSDDGTVISWFDEAPKQTPADPEDPGLDDEPGEPGTVQVQHISVPGGRGVLARAEPQPGGDAVGPLYLITDQGIRYPIPGKARESLGYQGVKAIALSEALLDLLPVGPELDPEAAREPVDESTGSED